MSVNNALTRSIIFSTLLISAAAAETAFVTDSFTITLRTEPSNRAKILAMPKSGTPLEVLTKQDEWTRVRMRGGKGKEGWVLGRYLVSRRPWKSRAGVMAASNTRLKEQVAELRGRVRELSSERNTTRGSLADTKNRLTKLADDYEALKKGSSQYVQVKELLDSTVIALDETKAALSKARYENKILRNEETKQWFLIGALVILGGFFIGVVVGKRTRKRRYY